MTPREITALRNVLAIMTDRCNPTDRMKDVLDSQSPGEISKDLETLNRYLKIQTAGDGTVKQADFEAIWKQYPKPVGKKMAIRHFFASVKTQNDLERIQKALANYTESYNVGRGFIQNGDRWFGDWQGWVDPTPAMMGGTKAAPEDQKQQARERFLKGTGKEDPKNGTR